MAEVHVTGRDGAVATLEANEGRPLMEALRDARLGVDGTCGGACSCGTCHVYVGPEWLGRLPVRQADEEMMLEALGEFVPLKPGSRLSCQIPVSADLAGMTLQIAPAVE